MVTRPLDILFIHNQQGGETFIKRIQGKRPLFICVIGTTATAKIPSISAAGSNPNITDYTPPADMELLLLGKCKCIDGVPVTPDGIPTPALITMSALKMADIPTLVACGGVAVKPQVPFLDFGGMPGGDIRTGKAVMAAQEVIQRAKIAGEHLARVTDYLVIGESIPGGTTTALGVLLAMGIGAEGKVSSSMPENPHSLKIDSVKAGLAACGERFGSLGSDPIKAISCVGDPMMAAFAGLAMGAASRIPVMMAGGTQMTAVLAIIKALQPSALPNLAIATTRWIASDPSSDLAGIVRQIGNVPVLAADINFGTSRFEGLKVYERGIVKEGVGAGGVSIAAMVKTEGSVNKATLLKKIEENYEALVGSRNK